MTHRVSVTNLYQTGQTALKEVFVRLTGRDLVVDEVYRGSNENEMNGRTGNLLDGIEQGVISGQLRDVGRGKGTCPGGVGLTTVGHMADGGHGFVQIDETSVK